MMYQLRHGTVEGKKTRSSVNIANRIIFGFIIIIFTFSLTGCKNDYVSLSEIQQPVQSLVENTPITIPQVNELTEESSPTPKSPALGIGGGAALQELQSTETPTLTETPFFELPFETATPTIEVVESNTGTIYRNNGSSANKHKCSADPLLHTGG